VEGFLAHQTAPTASELVALILAELDKAMEFPRPEHRPLIAAWAIASYFFPLFLTFPRLNLSGERESGKSKVLGLLHAIAFNALLMLDPTAPVVYRLIQAYRPTMLLDEVEGLNKDDAKPILAVINSGYKAGGTVPRCEGDRIKYVEPFAVYGPLALAAIKPVNVVTEDRCIPLVLQRGTDRRRINAEVNREAEGFAAIRAGCYRLLLTRWREVRDAYATVELPPWLNGRARELWRAPLTIAAVADRENGLAITGDLLELARAHVRDRDPVSAEGEALLAVLAERLDGAESILVRPGDLGDDLRRRLGWSEAPTPHAVGAWLRRLGFPRGGRDRGGAHYSVTAERLREQTARYGLAEGDR
jgi:putative DNA primase/helicase